MTEITVDVVLETLESIIEEYGEDYEYDAYANRGCFYVGADGGPSCIVGHVLYRLDPELFKEISHYEATHFNSFQANKLVSERHRLLSHDFGTPAVRNVLAAAQYEQDKGYPWGVALNSARKRAARIKEWGE